MKLSNKTVNELNEKYGLESIEIYKKGETYYVLTKDETMENNYFIWITNDLNNQYSGYSENGEIEDLKEENGL